jgi:microcystin-dependent protein
MSWWKWSTTAASNSNADPTINWAEGQSPSSVNDSARAEMAAAAKYFADQDGSITTGGTSTAYTVATNGSFDSLAHLANRSVCFVPHTTNGATVTLAVDGLTARPLRYGPSLELQSGMLIQGTPYRAFYNNSDGAFYLHSFKADPFGIPLGGMLPYVGSSAPNTAFALPFGQAISRTTYATLFSLISTTFGTGDGSTTFNLPDLRGRAIFGLDNMGGSAANRITIAGGNFNGATLGATGGAENHMLSQAEMPVHNHGITDPGHSHNVKGQQDTTAGAHVSINATLSTAICDGTTPSTTGITINNAGGGSAHTIMPPSMVLPFIIRVI